MCVWTIITLSNLELLVQPGNEKASKTLTLFIFLKKILVCLFPINMRDVKPKKACFGQKQGKNGGKQTNSKFFLENRQSKYFCLTYFSKLNRDQVEKKLWHFEDNPVSGGNLAENPEKATPFVGFWHLKLLFRLFFDEKKEALFWKIKKKDHNKIKVFCSSKKKDFNTYIKKFYNHYCLQKKKMYSSFIDLKTCFFFVFQKASILLFKIWNIHFNHYNFNKHVNHLVQMCPYPRLPNNSLPLVEKNFLVFTRGEGNYSEPRFREKQTNFLGEKIFFPWFHEGGAIIRQFRVVRIFIIFSRPEKCP